MPQASQPVASDLPRAAIFIVATITPKSVAAVRGLESGTFCGYARSPARIERMLTNMFVGNPPGTYDRLLDFRRAVTGTLFFVPPGAVLEKGAG